MRSLFVVVLVLVMMTLNSSACPIDVTPTTLNSATQGSAYSETLSGNGGTAPYNFTLESGSLPAGVSLSIEGTLSGTPTDIGLFNFSVFVVDADSCNVSQQFFLTVTGACASITVNPPVLASGNVGQAYSVIMTAAGGATPYNFSVSAGALPAGITLSDDGVLSGTPTEAGVFSLSITATDSDLCTGSRDYNLTTSCATITVNPASLTPSLGNPFTATLSATGGAAPYSFAVADGALPAGLTLTDGVISGTPTEVGDFNVTISATDNNMCSGFRTYVSSVHSISVTSPDTLSDATLDTAILSVTFTANGTVGGPFTWSSSNLPAGLTLSSAGVLSGSPHIYGTIEGITIRASSGGYVGSRNYTLNVNACPDDVSVTPDQLESAIAGETYTASISTSSGQGYYDFALPSGGLPAGLSLATTGTVTGTATETGDFTFNVTATRRNAPCGTISDVVSLHVCQGWDVLLKSNVSELFEGDHLNAIVTLSDESGNDVSVDWESTVETGELPPGVSLSADGVLSGTPDEAGTYEFTVVIKVNSGADSGCEYTASFTITVSEKDSASHLSSWLSML